MFTTEISWKVTREWTQQVLILPSKTMIRRMVVGVFIHMRMLQNPKAVGKGGWFRAWYKQKAVLSFCAFVLPDNFHWIPEREKTA